MERRLAIELKDLNRTAERKELLQCNAAALSTALASASSSTQYRTCAVLHSLCNNRAHRSHQGKQFARELKQYQSRAVSWDWTLHSSKKLQGLCTRESKLSSALDVKVCELVSEPRRHLTPCAVLAAENQNLSAAKTSLCQLQTTQHDLHSTQRELSTQRPQLVTYLARIL